jgi:hypothetical protein
MYKSTASRIIMRMRTRGWAVLIFQDCRLERLRQDNKFANIRTTQQCRQVPLIIPKAARLKEVHIGLYRNVKLFLHSFFRNVSRSDTYSRVLILGVCILLRVWDQGDSVFRLRNFNIVGFYYLFNCATCFGHTTMCVLEDGRMTETVK